MKLWSAASFSMIARELCNNVAALALQADLLSLPSEKENLPLIAKLESPGKKKVAVA